MSVREEIGRLLWMDGDTSDAGWEHTASRRRLLSIADQILSLKHPNGEPMIGVLSEDQSLPPNTADVPVRPFSTDIHAVQVLCGLSNVYTQAQQDMLKANFKRIEVEAKTGAPLGEATP